MSRISEFLERFLGQRLHAARRSLERLTKARLWRMVMMVFLKPWRKDWEWIKNWGATFKRSRRQPDHCDAVPTWVSRINSMKAHRQYHWCIITLGIEKKRTIRVDQARCPYSVHSNKIVSSIKETCCRFHFRFHTKRKEQLESLTILGWGGDIVGTTRPVKSVHGNSFYGDYRQDMKMRCPGCEFISPQKLNIKCFFFFFSSFSLFVVITKDRLWTSIRSYRQTTHLNLTEPVDKDQYGYTRYPKWRNRQS